MASKLTTRKAAILAEQFGKMVQRVGVDQIEGAELALMEAEGGWVLTDYHGEAKLGAIGAWVPDDAEKGEIGSLEVRKIFGVPPLEGDETGKLIGLVAHLVVMLNNYTRTAKLNSKPADEASEAARKAANARWEKWRKDHGK